MFLMTVVSVVEFISTLMSCVRNVLEDWAVTGKEINHHRFFVWFRVSKRTMACTTIWLFLRGENNIHNNHKVFLFLGEETRSCAYFHDQRGRVKLQHCGSSGQGAVWSVDVVGTSNRHTNSSCQTQDPPAPRAPGSPAVASAHVRAVDSSREGNLKTVLDSSATQRNTVQGARFRLKLPSISHKQVRFFVIYYYLF